MKTQLMSHLSKFHTKRWLRRHCLLYLQNLANASRCSRRYSTAMGCNSSEFKVSDGNNRTDTITGIVPIDNEGSEAIGFLHYAGNYNAYGWKLIVNSG